MNNATGTPLFHALASSWRAMGAHALSVEQLADDWGISTSDALDTLQQLAADHLAFELPTQAGRWRRVWPRFVCLPDAADPLPNYASYGTSPSMAMDRWGAEHLPQLAAEGMIDVNDGIAVAVYHTEAVATWTSDMPALQIGVVNSFERREVLLWEGCSYCWGEGTDPNSEHAQGEKPKACPGCAMYEGYHPLSDAEAVVITRTVSEEIGA